MKRIWKFIEISIILLALISPHSCLKSPKEYHEELKSTEIQGLIIGTETKKSGYSLLTTQNTDTLIIYNTGVTDAHAKFFIGDSIFKAKGQMIYTVKRKDSVFKYDGNNVKFN